MSSCPDTGCDICCRKVPNGEIRIVSWLTIKQAADEGFRPSNMPAGDVVEILSSRAGPGYQKTAGDLLNVMAQQKGYGNWQLCARCNGEIEVFMSPEERIRRAQKSWPPWEENERRRQELEERASRTHKERQERQSGVIQERRQQGLCILCGKRLNYLLRLCGKDHHKGCYFRE